uniref:CCHC-type domain-containing protein n=1 Tax=Triticum urartu TaxID=4572 RepID=A0A8R7U835_TRIUA
SSCDTAQAVDAQPGEGPWIFVGRKGRPRGNVRCDHASQSAKLVQAAAFRRRTYGRCFRCLAPDHKAAFCRDPIRCLTCLRSGHRERDCCLRLSSVRAPRRCARAFPAPPCPSSDSRSWASVVAPVVHAEVLESVRFSEASSGGSSDHEVVAKSSESLLASSGSDPQVMMELALRPLHKLEDSLCLWLARATSLLERAEASVGLQGSLPTTQAALVANHRDQGTEDIGNTMQPLTLGLVAPVVTTEISLASSISDEVQAVAKGCAFAIDEGDTLHDLTELIKCLIAMPAITQGLIRLVKAEQTKHANQVVCAAVRVNSAT